MPAPVMIATDLARSRSAPRWANSPWSTAMSVTRPALSRRQGRARHLGDDARRRPRAGAPRSPPARPRPAHTRRARAPCSRKSATAPFSATIAATGRLGDRLAPAHRPAGDGDHRQAGLAQGGEGGERAGRDRPFGRQRVVDVGQHAANAGQHAQVAPVPGLGLRIAHAASDRKPPRGRAPAETLKWRFLPRSVARHGPVPRPRLGPQELQPRSPARWSSWVSRASLSQNRRAGSTFDRSLEMNAVLKPHTASAHVVADL